ncbi:bifunctional (p)ppGpp synthetase/guanosine-3',5'-bis(diphosphate) 3'-pyrophosphohydrolase [Dysgonomonas sp. 25]|nr:bifunctional (p)ppGpp synthetase/guanosine-3',5'-bis(diphosphate) 3'-pyrophosphohydrolase [Dysgonomonas sp. 25]
MKKDYNVTPSIAKRLLKDAHNSLSAEEFDKLRNILKESLRKGIYQRGRKSFSLLESIVNTALVAMEYMGLRSSAILAVFLYNPVTEHVISEAEVKKTFGQDVSKIVKGLIKINDMEATQSALASENYANLLLSMAEDMRVIFLMIANRLYMMRNAMSFDEKIRMNLLTEVSYLYTPLAHKLGLYAIKTEFEDLYLKYTDPDSYIFVERKISESREVRDKYIREFIKPIENRLKDSGLKYDIKGRVKSISSINNKLKKQQVDFEHIYDLFAIRIILDSEESKEKAECWQVYSVVADLYTPNPKRLKDWLSIPKSNGYESLHTTVMGPESRWVEVQIRTKRMDEVAEKGFAAHWKYKGVKDSQSKLDEWLANLREVLENDSLGTAEKLEAFKLDLYDEEIYVFTPKGDLHKLPKGATVLDFAFSIHSKVGATCVSGLVNGKNVPIRHKLKSGDQIEILTSPNQSPKQDWLNIVTTSKAKNRIRQQLKEEANKQVEIAKELLARRFKNRKIEDYEPNLMRLIKKLGFKTVTGFYIKIADGTLDINNVIDQYLDFGKKETELHEKHETTSADQFIPHLNEDEKHSSSGEELVIDHNLTGIDYKLAKCCNPIYGDEIFGFVSSQGIKIHRKNCPNAKDMFARFAYRVVPARWSGKSASGYIITLRIIGKDDIGIINNLTSIISKESGVSMRSISIDSIDGLFQGNMSVMLSDTTALNGLIKKLKTVKGVKEVSRLN